ncbi:MAG TPA: myxosortase-dependent metalloprotease, MXAN_2677/MXAN_2678 family [Myxococcaceae bacterium]|nr:myxosortase-dependent metalloprotease, MXAN_2677/MXAN_2678 family [Myxococcaceae bacterium]
MTAIAPLALVLVLGPYVRTKVDRNDVNSHCLLWTSPQITFVQDTLGTEDTQGNRSEFTAFSRSLASWNQAATACSSVRLTEGPRVAERKIGWEKDAPDNHNVVLYRRVGCTAAAPNNDPCWGDNSCYNKYDCWGGRTGTLALTTTTYDLDTGHIHDTDIEANDLFFFFTTVDAPQCGGSPSASCVSSDVQNTMTHELGHALGLDHAPETFSTMFATADKGEIAKRQIDSDSARYLCEAYPYSGIPLDCVALRPPHHHLGGVDTSSPFGCASATGGPALALLAAAALRAFGRRRARPLR